MSLTFPTGHKLDQRLVDLMVQPPIHGEPQRANACKCGPRAFIDHETSECVICGRYPADTINRTWQRRAQHLAKQAA